MGVYLSEPIKTKTTFEGKEKNFSYAVSSMQGWRSTMEDCHICEPKFTSEHALFGVFDGHGGNFFNFISKLYKFVMVI